MGGWQDYINYMTNGNCVEEAHILGKEDGAMWCSSKGLAAVINPHPKIFITFKARSF